MSQSSLSGRLARLYEVALEMRKIRSELGAARQDEADTRISHQWAVERLDRLIRLESALNEAIVAAITHELDAIMIDFAAQRLKVEQERAEARLAAQRIDCMTEESIRHITSVVQCILWHAIVEQRENGKLRWTISVADEDAARRYLPIRCDVDQTFLDALLDSRLPEDSERMNAVSSAAIKENRGYRQDFRCRMADGSVKWLTENVSVTPISDGVWRVVGVSFDITDRKHSEQRMREQMSEIHDYSRSLERERKALSDANERLVTLVVTDGLTGLKNHRAFQEKIVHEVYRTQRYSHALSLLALDVDRFKDFNDTFGHPAGDEVLKKVAEILTANARTSDFVARYGGEEFMVILPNTDSAGAVVLAERYRLSIERASWPLRAITASFGVASVSPSTLNPAQVIYEADAAMYESKRAGRNRTTHFAQIRGDSNRAM